MQSSEPTLAVALAQDAAALDWDLSSAQQGQLLDYLALIEKWNAVYNLTAIRDPSAMLTQHLVDCLAILPPLARLTEGRPVRILDVGSGAGLPGIVLAIAMPHWAVTCIDTVGKKAAFMRQAKSILQLPNLWVEEGRVERLNQTFEIVVSRAFASLSDFTHLCAHALEAHGSFIAMKGILPTQEISALTPEWHVRDVLPLVVPRLRAERHLVFIERTS